ncbi:MAG: bifunctional diaminohydroxyphosphoribosylaminopyrimidine deaminase/5-amino-6-(5-phosphoribosylamino)uracil reductase RibD [Armatimonadetes bacterium]|nr:bifunctional diaminohydroxyphosphoribosylaminopyrimidine deaminase/5-amino-6-(5-phosphoribosylamino)uracil reductase RibD [Armatimonadota bacterium]
MAANPANPEAFMRRAIQLSRRGYPAPNPRVGCVLVRGGKIVGEGYHQHAGGSHAEVVALQQAGANARGADAYVTLEPCNHRGRTGPCTEALMEAGVKRVIYAVDDPNPVAAGGAARLRKAGLQVESGLLAEEAESVNSQFLTAVRRQLPFVTLKAAMGLDGRSVLSSGDSKWITSPKARALARKMRGERGAVLVGCGTVLADHPSLTARSRGIVNEPTRIILDPQGRAQSYPWPSGGEVIRVTEPGRGGEIEQPLVGGVFDLRALLTQLYARGIRGVLVEGGPPTINGFLKQGLGDELALFSAGKILGDGATWTGVMPTGRISERPEWSLETVKRVGPDLLTCWHRM